MLYLHGVRCIQSSMTMVTIIAQINWKISDYQFYIVLSLSLCVVFDSIATFLKLKITPMCWFMTDDVQAIRCYYHILFLHVFPCSIIRYQLRIENSLPWNKKECVCFFLFEIVINTLLLYIERNGRYHFSWRVAGSPFGGGYTQRHALT